MLREYEVLTPEYEAVEDYVLGHVLTVPARDWVVVCASSKREAVQIAVRGWLAEGPSGWRRMHANYAQGRKQDGLCPWTGIRAQEWEHVDAA